MAIAGQALAEPLVGGIGRAYRIEQRRDLPRLHRPHDRRHGRQLHVDGHFPVGIDAVRIDLAVVEMAQRREQGTRGPGIETPPGHIAASLGLAKLRQQALGAIVSGVEAILGQLPQGLDQRLDLRLTNPGGLEVTRRVEGLRDPITPLEGLLHHAHGAFPRRGLLRLGHA